MSLEILEQHLKEKTKEFMNTRCYNRVQYCRRFYEMQELVRKIKAKKIELELITRQEN